MQQRTRGRPPKYDRNDALNQAIATFLSNGYSATSLDELAESMGMNRPSIYNAFGNKQSIYRHALAHFVAGLRETLGTLLFTEPELQLALKAFYRGALDVYFADQPARGCFVFCTAPVEGVVHPEIADDIRAILSEIDDTLSRRFEQGTRDGEFPGDADCRQSARLAQAVLHSIAVRARAGDSRQMLEEFVDFAVTQLCAVRAEAV